MLQNVFEGLGGLLPGVVTRRHALDAFQTEPPNFGSVAMETGLEEGHTGQEELFGNGREVTGEVFTDVVEEGVELSA